MVKSFRLVVNNREYVVEIGDLSQSPLTVVVNGKPYLVEVQAKPAGSGNPGASVAREAGPVPKEADPPVSRKPAVEAAAVIAPLPCKVLEIRVRVGDRVKVGDALFVVESMKMEVTIPAPREGVIKAIRVAVGQTMRQGEVLAEIE